MAKNKPMSRDLNMQQEMFCKHYVSEEFFGSGVAAYCEAYGKDINNPKDYNVAKVMASKLLTAKRILVRINQMLDNEGLNDSFVDKQLLFAITQNADLNSKVRAINEYNKLRQRINNNINLSIKVEQPLFNDVPANDSNKQNLIP